MYKYLILLVILFVCISCSDKKLYVLRGHTMGTSYSIKYVDGIDRQKIIKEKIESFLIDYNQIFSTYIDGSQISILNKAQIKKRIKVSKELFRLLKTSRSISEKTDGYYDTTIGPLVNRWGFGPVKAKGQPSTDEISRLKKNIGYKSYKLLTNSFEVIKGKQIYIDLSSIAKGDGVDALSRILESEFRVKNYFVEIGGEVFARGVKPNGQSWRVGVESPLANKGVQRIVDLDNKAIATSGSYRNYKKYGDSIFSHMIDPKTGYPVKHKLISVSVIAKTCALADAWATALMSLGPEKGLKLAKEQGLSTFFLIKDNDTLNEKMTGDFL